MENKINSPNPLKGGNLNGKVSMSISVDSVF